MKTLFSIVGYILITASIITPLSMITFQLPNFPNDIFKEGIFPGLIAFIFGFFPGIYLVNIAKGRKEENKLNKIALIIMFTILIFFLSIFIYGASHYIKNPDANLGLLFIFLTPIPYGVSLILLIIDYFKQKNN